jgi:NADP+-dependent farnesol dehydrogenase
MDKWIGRVAVVTGSNSGIGFAILTSLASHGIKVVGLDVRVDAIEKLKNEGSNKEIYAIVCDVTKDEPTEAAFDWIESNLGGCDILINNAGMLRTIGVLEYQKPMWELEMNVNVNYTAAVRCARLAFKSMDTRGTYGYIINTSSVCGHTVEQFKSSIGVYWATKFGITATANVMRTELVNLKNLKVRVTNISPGRIRTNLFNHAQMSEAEQNKIYSAPALEPHHIADTVNYFLSLPYEVNVCDIIIRATGADL